MQKAKNDLKNIDHRCLRKPQALKKKKRERERDPKIAQRREKNDTCLDNGTFYLLLEKKKISP